MVGQFEVTITGLGNYIVEASIYRDKTHREDFTCEVDVASVKKFNPFQEEYVDCDIDDNELLLLEKEVAIKFLNNLH